MKKFSINRTGEPLVATIGSLILLLFVLLSPNVHVTDPRFLCVVLVWTLVAVDLFFGTFIIIDKEEVYTVDYFVYKKGLNIDQIENINYAPTWGPRAPNARTLSISGVVSGRNKEVKLGTNHFFSRKTLAAIVEEIKHRKPSVDLDESTKLLLENYS
jgi:hypothetical protein